MGHLLALALSFPAIVYTALLGIVLVYWIFVVLGAAHVNVLGDADGTVDAAIDGVAKGAVEGAAKGMFEGAADHFVLDGAHGDVAAVAEGAHTGLIASLRLRSVPATVVVSAELLSSWIVVMLGMQALEVLMRPGVGFTIAKVALLVVAPVAAVVPTVLALRPLARAFTPVRATTHDALVGRLCTIRTGTVTDRFGEATLEDGGAGVVLRVRVEAGEKLGRGDQALIVGYDAARQEFTVAPMTDLLVDDPPGERKGVS